MSSDKDEKGIPILEEVVSQETTHTENQTVTSTNRQSKGRRQTDLMPSISITEARIIIDQLGPEIEKIIERTITRKMQAAVDEAVKESTASIREQLLGILKGTIRHRQKTLDKQK